jgi:multimeric flavodoxin WrbA/putative sterol carrier protein
MEKGRCWIADDHADIAERLLAADGIVLASPVYFSHVTAQMKTFIDRSLGLGHKPVGRWKPGLAVSVSAGLGEIQVAEYLAGVLRAYGAFAVGRLTALATSPGAFIGKEAVESRAADLANDLARAILEKRRYPATERDLRYYQFMGALVRDHRDALMRDDFEHWECLGLYGGFDRYIQQKAETVRYDPAARKAWLKEMIARHRVGGGGAVTAQREGMPGSGRGEEAATCRALLQAMPRAFDAAAAKDLAAVYQFEIRGHEEFTAHLRIEEGKCTYHDGRADRPDVIVRSPSDVWLAIARKDIDGRQAYMTGKYQAEGDLMLLLRFESLFGG